MGEPGSPPPSPGAAGRPPAAIAPSSDPLDAALAQRVQILRLEHLAAQVAGHLAARGAHVLLIKGPVTNAWLYGGAEARGFRDIDVLIRPSHRRLVDEALAGSGFGDLHAPLLPLHRPDHERTWERHGLLLDVHTRFAGVPSTCAEQAFEALWVHRRAFVLQGRAVPVLSEPARAIHLALHAAQSRADARALRDLDRGVAVLPLHIWSCAVRLCEDLRCEAAFAAGLRKTAAGSHLGRTLGVRPRSTTEVALRSRGATIEAQNLWETLSCGRGERMTRRILTLLDVSFSTPVSLRTRLSAGARVGRAVFSIAAAATLSRISAVTPRAQRRPTDHL